jgi:hypothetical protein
MSKSGGIQISAGGKDRDYQELNNMLEMDRDALGPGKLAVIDPEKWKNSHIGHT